MWRGRNIAKMISNNKFQVGSIVTTVVISLLLLRAPMQRLNISDPWPEVISFVPQKQTGTSIAEVKVGLFVRSLPEFDINSNKFVFAGIIWFEFNPSLLSLDTVEKFSFEKGTILKKSSPETKIIGDNLFVHYKIRVAFASNLHHKFFPFSDHRIFIVLLNEFVSPNEFIFKASESGFSMPPKLQPRGWKPVNFMIRPGYAYSYLDKYDPKKRVASPRVVFAIDFAKAGLRRILVIIIPLFLVFFLALFSLVFDPAKYARPILSLSAGSASGLLAYRFVIERISPSVGYFTIADHVYTLFLASTFIIFLFNIYSIVNVKRSKHVYLIKNAMFLVIQLGVIIIWYYLLYQWGR